MRNHSKRPFLFFLTQFFLPQFFLALAVGVFFCGTIFSSLSWAAKSDAESDKAAPRLFVTRDGDRIVGTLLNPEEKPRVEFKIQTPGGKVTVHARNMSSSRLANEKEIEYAKRRAAAANTVKAQLELAEWCRQNHFLKYRKDHLRRVIKLDPDHKESRASLGYRFFNDKWMTQEEIQASRGYKRYKGRWLTEQQIEKLKKEEAWGKKEKKWYIDIKRYLGWIDTGRHEVAMRALGKIKDPTAVAALGRFLASNASRETKVLLIHILGNIIKANPKESDAAYRPLSITAMEDPDEEVRMSCLDIIKKSKKPLVVDFFVANLNVKLATRKYKKDSNMMINRAGHALGAIGDKSAVQPLINALVTTHKEKIVSGGEGKTSAAFSPQGGGGLSMGTKTTIVANHIKNQDVLVALKKLAGVTFNFDQQAWQAWYDRTHQQQIPDTRRRR